MKGPDLLLEAMRLTRLSAGRYSQRSSSADLWVKVSSAAHVLRFVEHDQRLVAVARHFQALAADFALRLLALAVAQNHLHGRARIAVAIAALVGLLGDGEASLLRRFRQRRDRQRGQQRGSGKTSSQ
jgi:hypothetical protein